MFGSQDQKCYHWHFNIIFSIITSIFQLNRPLESVILHQQIRTICDHFHRSEWCLRKNYTKSFTNMLEKNQWYVSPFNWCSVVITSLITETTTLKIWIFSTFGAVVVVVAVLFSFISISDKYWANPIRVRTNVECIWALSQKMRRRRRKKITLHLHSKNELRSGSINFMFV